MQFDGQIKKPTTLPPTTGPKLAQSRGAQTDAPTDVQDKRESLTTEARKELFDSQKKLTTTQPPIPDEVNDQLETSLDQVPDKTIANNIQNVPEPNQLQRTRSQSQLQLSQTLRLQQARTIGQQQTERMQQAKPLELDLLGLDDAQSSQLKRELTHDLFENRGDRDSRIQDQLRPHLEPLLKELSKGDRQLLGSDKAKQKVNTKVNQEMMALMQSLGGSDELSLLLKSHMAGKDDRAIGLALKPVLAALVGEVREGRPQTYEQLSDKKKAFVNQTIIGLIDGIRGSERLGLPPHAAGMKQQPTHLAQNMDQLMQHLETQLGQLTPGQLASLKNMGRDELEAFLTPVLAKSQILMPLVMPLLLDKIRGYQSDSTPRGIPTEARELSLEDLKGPGVMTTLQALKQVDQNGKDLKEVRLDVTARQNAVDALLPHVNDMLQDDNLRQQLQMLGKNHFAYMLKQLEPKLSDDDALWLATQMQQQVPQSGNVGQNKVMLQHSVHGELEVPEQLTLNGVTYEAKQFLDKAGFGAVMRYEEVGNPNNQIAVKVITAQGNSVDKAGFEARQEIAKEINLHRELQGQGSERVIGLKGTLMGSDDSLYMVQEFASGGTIANLAQTLETARDQLQVLSPEAQRLLGLYVVRQGIQGLDYMHNEREMLHLDMKPHNLMLGGDGNVKLIDFGTCHLGTDGSQFRTVDNQIFLAPEQAAEKVVQSQVTTGSDMWGMGIVAYRMLIGNHEQHNMLGHGFMYQIGKELIGFQKDVDNRFMDGSPKMPQGGPSETDRPVFELLNSMLAPHSDQRISSREALQHEAFLDPKLDAPELKQVFQKLGQRFPSSCQTPEQQQAFKDLPKEDQIRARMLDIQPELQALGLA